MSGYQGSAASARPASVNGAQANASTPGLVKMLTGPGIAPADTAVRGDDLRLVTPPGGVAFARACLAGAAPNTNEGGPSWPGETRGFAVLVRCRLVPNPGSPREFIVSDNGGGYGFCLFIDPPTGRLVVSRFNTVFGATAEGTFIYGEETTLIYSRTDLGAGELYKDGVLVASVGEDFPRFEDWVGAYQLGYYQAGSSCAGEIREFRVFNRGLTPDEIAALTAGKPVPALLHAGRKVKAGITTENGRVGFGEATEYSGEYAGGGSSTIIGTFGPYSGAKLRLSDRPKQGQRIRARIQVSNFAAQGATCAVYAFSDTAPNHVVSAGLLINADGLYVYEADIESLAPGQDFQIVIANNAPTGSFTGRVLISDVTYFGAVASYQPGDVVPSGRWRDSSGNFFDLLPAGLGVTPLNPIEFYTRVFPGTVTATLPGLDAGGYNEASPLVASTSPALAAVQAGDVVSVSFDAAPPGGVYIRASQKAPSAGQVPVLLGGPPESAPLVISSVPVTVTHIVN
ncbi:MAG: Concanavalin A-like lectin/glucanase superfamily [Verrucomicrobiota bacterium]|jgi:hypothetical protein